jgi:hypothetical protein
MDKVDDVTALLEEMKQYLSYDPETGHFTWIKVKLKSKSKVGDIIGSLSRGYIGIKFNFKSYRAHRLAWLFTYGKWPTNHIDHIDGNRSNNKLSNLRDVTNQENQFNINKILAKSGYLGVSKYKSRSWRARIMLNGKDICLGHYETPELASEAYQAAKLKYHVIGGAVES